jgi:hypothetical protein
MLPPQCDVVVYAVACSAAGRAVWIYLTECEALYVLEKVGREREGKRERRGERR